MLRRLIAATVMISTGCTQVDYYRAPGLPENSLASVVLCGSVHALAVDGESIGQSHLKVTRLVLAPGDHAITLAQPIPKTDRNLFGQLVYWMEKTVRVTVQEGRMYRYFFRHATQFSPLSDEYYTKGVFELIANNEALTKITAGGPYVCPTNDIRIFTEWNKFSGPSYHGNE